MAELVRGKGCGQTGLVVVGNGRGPAAVLGQIAEPGQGIAESEGAGVGVGRGSLGVARGSIHKLAGGEGAKPGDVGEKSAPQGFAGGRLIEQAFDIGWGEEVDGRFACLRRRLNVRVAGAGGAVAILVGAYTTQGVANESGRGEQQQIAPSAHDLDHERGPALFGMSEREIHHALPGELTDLFQVGAAQVLAGQE